MLSCRTRGFCPSCHAKRLKEWGEAFLVGRELLSPEWAERLLSWRHTGFSVHSLVRATTKPEAERVGKYMIRPLLSLERLSFVEPEGKAVFCQAKFPKKIVPKSP